MLIPLAVKTHGLDQRLMVAPVDHLVHRQHIEQPFLGFWWPSWRRFSCPVCAWPAFFWECCLVCKGFVSFPRLEFSRSRALIRYSKRVREEWGGSFEIWNTGMTEKVASFVPIFNRMVCFSTASDTWHGNG